MRKKNPKIFFFLFLFKTKIKIEGGLPPPPPKKKENFPPSGPKKFILKYENLVLPNLLGLKLQEARGENIAQNKILQSPSRKA